MTDEEMLSFLVRSPDEVYDRKPFYLTEKGEVLSKWDTPADDREDLLHCLRAMRQVMLSNFLTERKQVRSVMHAEIPSARSEYVKRGGRYHGVTDSAQHQQAFESGYTKAVTNILKMFDIEIRTFDRVAKKAK